MLDNDPPPGTRVQFTRDVRKAKAYETAVLVRAMQKYATDKPTDTRLGMSSILLPLLPPCSGKAIVIRSTCRRRRIVGSALNLFRLGTFVLLTTHK